MRALVLATAASVWAASAVAGPAGAAAQWSPIDSLAAPAGGQGRPEPAATPERPPRAAEEEAPSPEDAFRGPLVQLGFDVYRLTDGYGGGRVLAGGVGVFLQLPSIYVRSGVYGEVGVRSYALGRGDILVRGELDIGGQLPGVIPRLVPYLSGVASVGGVIAERFETPVSYLLGGGGVRLGADVRLVRSFHAGASVSYQRLRMDGVGFNVWMLRLVLGF